MQRSLTVRFLQSNMGLILQVSLISFFHAQHEIKEQLYLLFLTACDHAYLSLVTASGRRKILCSLSQTRVLNNPDCRLCQMIYQEV